MLDGWRGLCLLAVLVAHFAPRLPIDFGALGVDSFFVLSGRLMADILFVEGEALGPFFVRRFSRVWPGLAVYVGLVFALFVHVPDGFLRVGPASALAALTFTTNYRVVLLGETELLDHTWSLAVEAHAYLLLGLVAFCCRRASSLRPRSILLGLTILTALNGLVESALPGPHPYLYWRSDVRVASVLVSAFLFLHVRATRPDGLRIPPISLAALAVGAALLDLTALPDPVHYTAGTLALALVFHALPERRAASAAERPVRRVLEGRVLVLLGTLSFSVYVWQQLPYKLLQELRWHGGLGPAAGLAVRPVLVVAAVGLGALSFRLIERPARRAINRRWAPVGHPAAEGGRMPRAVAGPDQASIRTSA